MKKNLFFFLFFFSFFAQAQYKNKEADIKKIFPDDEVVLLNYSEKLSIDIVDGKLKIESLNEQETIYLNTKFNAFGGIERSISYSPFFNEITNIEAASFVPNGNRFEKISVTDFKSERSSSNSVFYDDAMSKKFSYAGIKKGAVTSLKYTELIKDPHMIGLFMFGNYIASEKNFYSISVPNSVEIAFKTFGNMDEVVFKTSTTKDGKTLYTWQSNNQKALKPESKSQNIRYLSPHVIPYIESYTINGITTNLLGDVPKLFAYYKDLVKNVNLNPSPELKQLADSLSKGKTEIEKIKSVYYWVQDNVKYIAFEEGMGGFVPREANDVCKKRYGDCKDMASLITTMLKSAGVKANMVWIGTRDIPYKYVENPTLSVDNHMIAATKIGKEWVYLDATDDHVDFGLPTNHIQGKEAMLMLDDGNFEIVNVPIVDAEINKRLDKITVKIDKNILTAKGQTSYDGLWKGELKHRINSFSDKQKSDFAENSFKLGNNKCKVEKAEILNLKKREEKLIFNYEINLPDYVKAIEDEIYVNPHLFKHQTPANEIDIEKRKTAIEDDYTWTEESITEIEVPAGYKMTEIPVDKSFKNPKFGFTITYKNNGNKIEIIQKTTYNILVLEKVDFEEFNKMNKLMMSAYNELITFKKI
jgi:transglutaminase-like putative cysteine protease